jgi:hypothetical protein
MKYREDLIGEAFHTAFRKVLDGELSVICWQIIYLLIDNSPDTWGTFIVNLTKNINQHGNLAKHIVINTITEQLHDTTGNEYSLLIILRASIDLLPIEDWTTLVEFVEECCFQ